MRVFASPNGSGKSSIIKSILNTKVKKGRSLDFGIYINADDIAVSLRNGGVQFSNFEVIVTIHELLKNAASSGLILKASNFRTRRMLNIIC